MSLPSSSQSSGDARSQIQGRRPAQIGKIEKAKDPRRALYRLAAYLAYYKWALGMVLIFVVIYTLLGLLGPYLMGQAIDRFIGGKNPTGLARLAIWMLVVYLLNNLFQAIANWVMARVSQNALKRMRGDLFEHLQELPIS